VNPFRLELARKLGATRAVDVRVPAPQAGAAPGCDPLDKTMEELGMVEGFDVGLEMSGNAGALRGLLAKMNHGGKVALLGIPPGEVPVDISQVIFKGLMVKGVYGREMFETWYKMAALLQGGLDVTPVITHRFPAARFLDAFAAAASGESGKVILDWSK
jgi:threonine 3-dehydrogenase